jgi:hypothetical protein
VRPTAYTLKGIAEGLGVLPLDLLTFPDEAARQTLIDATRDVPQDALKRVLRELPPRPRSRGARGA